MNIPEDIAEALCQDGYAPTKEGIEEYLRDLADDYEIHYWEVEAAYSILGVNEMFDGVVTACEDMADGY